MNGLEQPFPFPGGLAVTSQATQGSNEERARAAAGSARSGALTAKPGPRVPDAQRPTEVVRSGLMYTRKLLLNPFNLYMVIAVCAFGLVTGHYLVLPLVLFAELALLATVPRMSLFRRHVDEALREMERAAAARAREALLLQMSESHRAELEGLDSMIEAIRENTRRCGAMVRMALDERVGLSRLTASYIQLAVAHKEKTTSLSLVSRQRLIDNIASLQSVREHTASPRVCRLVERRLGIAERHLEHWERTRSQVEAISHQLATISELVRLLHAQAMSVSGSQELGDEIDRFMADFNENEGTLRELAEFGSDGL